MRFAFFLLISASLAAAQALEVTDLRCEDLVAPIGVDLPQPTLSWRMEQAGGPRGQKQTAYQVLVSTTTAKLAANDGDLWDSGQVSSEQSLRISYAGSVLTSRQRCHWKVRVWDKDGHPSAWSAPSEWTVGFLSPSDWSAKWIAHSASGLDGAQWIWFNEGNPASSAPPATRQFRRTITLPGDRTLVAAKVRLTADNSCSLTVNGQAVASGNDWTQPVDADITAALQTGNNTLAISATNSGTSPSPAGLVARFDFTFATGEPLTVVTDVQWEASSNGNQWSSALSLGAYGISPWGSVSSASFPHPWMRRNFEVTSTVNRALVFVNTPGHFELYLNGSKVSDDVLAPAYSDFTKRMFVVAYDVTSLLQPGSNCIALWTAPGWYQTRYGNPHGSPIVRAQLDIETSNGIQSIGTDSSWRTKESCITQVGGWGWSDMGGERWDAAKFIDGWNLASYNATSWPAAKEVTAPAVFHSWLALPGNRTLTPIPAARVFQSNGKWLIDFGTTLVGWVNLRLAGLTLGQQITIDYADLVDKPELMHIADSNGFQTFGQHDIFVAGSSPTGEFRSRFNQHAFRYAVIGGLTSAPALTDAEALPVMTALEPIGSFESSNPLFNKIYNISMATYRTQMPVGVLGGGESREKEGYGDAGAFLTGLLYNFRSDSYFRKWIDDYTDSQRADGFFTHTAPRHVDHGGGPPWGGQPSEMTRRLLLYHGDASVISSVYPSLKRYVDFIETKTQSDILRYYSPYNDNGPWFLGDWVTPTASEDEHGFPNDTMEEKEFFNNCYRVILWDQLATFAEKMGDTAEATRCRNRLAVIRPLIHSEFFDAATNTYRANRQAFLVVALLACIMPDALRPVILQQLVDNITVTRNGHLGTGMIGTSFMLDLLAREGRNDLVAMMMAKKTYPSWGFLSETRGVTTWPESWTGWGSQIILVTASPAAWFHEGLAGLRPDPSAPGFKKITVKPGVVREADWARASHQSPYGAIAVEWRKQGGGLALDVTVPPNSAAEIHVPASNAGEVSESGQAASSAPGVQFLRMENGRAVFAVGSGTYAFTGTLPATLGPVVDVTSGSPLALDYPGSQTIASLLLGGVSQPPGTYSAATHPAWFTGTGSLLVMPESRVWNNGASTGKWNATDANWTAQTWSPGGTATLAHSATASTITLEGSLTAGSVNLGNGSNNAAYTLTGPGSLAAGNFTVQGSGSNDLSNMPSARITDANLNISGDLGLGRAGLIIGGSSIVSAKRLGGTGIGGITSADWGLLTLQDNAQLTATDGISGNTTAWGVNLNGGTLITKGINYGPHSYGGTVNLIFNGTWVKANQDNVTFLTVTGGLTPEGPTAPVVQAGGAKFDTNGFTVGLGLALTGSGPLSKLGAGTLTLDQTHSYQGGTTVEAGTLTVAGTLGSGDLSVVNGAAAELNNPSGAVADSAAVRLTGSGRIHLAAGVTETVAQLHIDGVLRMAGTWNAARDPLHFSGPGNLVVTSGGAPTPGEAWRFQHFNSYNNSGDSADHGDPDNDGALNLLERALGSNPKAGDASGKPIANPGTPDFSFTYTRSKAATDLVIDVEFSPNLAPASWQKASPADGTNTLTDDTHPDVQTWRFNATTSEPRMFYRLRVR